MSRSFLWFHDIHVYDLGGNKWTLAKAEATDQAETDTVKKVSQ